MINGGWSAGTPAARTSLVSSASSTPSAISTPSGRASRIPPSVPAASSHYVSAGEPSEAVETAISLATSARRGDAEPQNTNPVLETESTAAPTDEQAEPAPTSVAEENEPVVTSSPSVAPATTTPTPATKAREPVMESEGGEADETESDGAPNSLTETGDGAVTPASTEVTRRTSQITSATDTASSSFWRGVSIGNAAVPNSAKEMSTDSPDATAISGGDEEVSNLAIQTDIPQVPDESATTPLAGGAVTTIPASGTGPEDGSSGDGSPRSGLSLRQAGIIAGSVAGAAGALIIISLFFWIQRKRRRRRRRRRTREHADTMRTPGIEEPPLSAARTGKTWEFDSESLGPTPRVVRMAGSVSYAVRSVISRPESPLARSWPHADGSNSHLVGRPESIDDDDDDDDKRYPPPRTATSAKDRAGEWWSRLVEDANFNWQMRNYKGDGDNITPAGTAAPDTAAPETAAPGPVTGPDRSSSSQNRHFSSALGLMLADAQARGNRPFSYAQASPPYPQQAYPPRPASRYTRRANAQSDQFDLELDLPGRGGGGGVVVGPGSSRGSREVLVARGEPPLAPSSEVAEPVPGMLVPSRGTSRAGRVGRAM